MSSRIRVLVVGCGHMGTAHARAYAKMPEFEIVGVVSRGPDSRGRLAAELGGVPQFDDYEKALAATSPEAVSINTYPDTHAAYAELALKAGAHVFVEKPLAQAVAEARAVADLAWRAGRKLVIGYILRHHPSWTKFVAIARTLGKPLVMRMNLNQQSCGSKWATHRQLINSLPPMVDGGVHYVDMMCLMTQARPVRVHAIGARLTDEVNPDACNYGQLQIEFDDGSVGWYEAGWGPMISETAYCVKDVIGPRGCASMVSSGADTASADTAGHPKTKALRVHDAALGPDGRFLRPDTVIDLSDEPDHQALCDREQAFFLKAIREDLDLTEHVADALTSLRIVLAADESVHSGRTVSL